MMIAQGVELKDRYRLDRLLGRGGMASVWLASDEVLERPVAVKVLSDTIASDPEFLARFRREARVAAGLTHPNLVGIYDYAEGSERPYLVMEHVSGGTLAERLDAGSELDCERLAHELLGALDHIHSAGIVHRDIKPQNILFAEDGSTRLIDFGIALPSDATALTRTGHLLGTARYIAPEVMKGGAATERSDLYSCGVVLRDCVGEGRRESLGVLVERLTAEDPVDRPSSARAAAALIGVVTSRLDGPTERLDSLPTETATREWRIEPEGGRRREARRPALPRREWARPAAALAAVAAIAVGVIALASGGGGGGEGEGRDAAVAKQGGANTPSSQQASTEEAAALPEPAGEDPAAGGSLNEQGYALIQEGRAEEAVPVLEEAVRSFPPGTEDLNYAYALYNLGNALRLSGRPEDAIPVLEQRLAIPNQTGVVRRELAAARAEASS
jgi:serine/threonine-protein kinase